MQFKEILKEKINENKKTYTNTSKNTKKSDINDFLFKKLNTQLPKIKL